MEMTKRMETAGRALNKLHEGVEKKEQKTNKNKGGKK